MTSCLPHLRQQYGEFLKLSFACREMGIASQTGRNQLQQKKFPIATVMRSYRHYVSVVDLALYLDGLQAQTKVRRRVGRPTNASRLAAQT